MQFAEVPPMTNTTPEQRTPMRKLTVDLPESVYHRYEDMYLMFRQDFRWLTRMIFAELVIEYGLSFIRIRSALSERGSKSADD